MTPVAAERFVRAASLAELRAAGRLVVHVDRHAVCLFADGDEVYAVDNRCPHMGFPLHRGTICDGILTCATIELLDANPAGVDVFRAGLDFGVLRRGGGWFRGLTTLTCFMNLVPWFDPVDRGAALYHGLADVASDSAMQPPHFLLEPLPGRGPGARRLAVWFRRFVDVRDAEGAERALVSAVRGGASQRELADMLFAAATDHRYLDGGHTLDFVNKALEALDITGWEPAEAVLASLPAQLARAERMEEANAWRNPVNLVALLEGTVGELPGAVAAGIDKRGHWDDRAQLVETILDGEASTIIDALLDALRDGASEVELTSAVSFAAATRIARFPTSNEFGDWDTALHTFTFANAVEQGLRRSPSVELLRGAFDAATSIHLDRFLNVPATRIPRPAPDADPDALLLELGHLLDRQQQVDEAGQLVASFLGVGGEPAQLVAALGSALVRENRNFHTIQCVEAAVRQHQLLADTGDAALPLLAAARYLAAHATTTRSQRQTFEIARRLHRGEKLYEEAPDSPAAM